MNKLNLKKQYDKPVFSELFEMISDLKDFLNQDADFKDEEWCKNFNTIVDFQDADGSFKLYVSDRTPSDARVDFVYIPTYICTAVLMKAYLKDCEAFGFREKSALTSGLKMSCARNLRGHGYEALKGQIDALNIFMKAGLREFMDLHSGLCPLFSEMIEKIICDYKLRESEAKFTGLWNESYEDEIRAVNEYFSHRKVFVYGTLMRDEANHGYLENSEFLSKATAEGYEMYDVGWYPAVRPADGMIIGELYDVPLDDIPAIDMLEGEGSLYVKKCEKVTAADGNAYLAFVYVYLGDVEGLQRIPAWGEEYVWYVSYGSNMLKERFMCYIEGGSFSGSRYHPPCEDTTPPLAVKPVEMPYDMYFGNESGSWHGSGVSFLDVTKPGRAYGVAYLITKKQFEHVCRRENDGRQPQDGYGWYENIIDIEDIDGFKAKTLTNCNLRPYNRPYPEYMAILFNGLAENWTDLSDEEIEEYLNGCVR